MRILGEIIKRMSIASGQHIYRVATNFRTVQLYRRRQCRICLQAYARHQGNAYNTGRNPGSIHDMPSVWTDTQVHFRSGPSGLRTGPHCPAVRNAN